MASPFHEEHGTLVVAALLILSLGFAGYWIIAYLRYGGAEWSSVLWFTIACGVIVVVGIVAGIVRERSERR